MAYRRRFRSYRRSFRARVRKYSRGGRGMGMIKFVAGAALGYAAPRVIPY